MLDAINRYDKRMARAVATSDTAEMKRIRDLASHVSSVTEIRKLLPSDTALVEYAFGTAPSDSSGRLYAWLITDHDTTFYQLADSPKDITEHATRLVSALRKRGRSNDWVDPAVRLYDAIMKPIRKDLGSRKRLVVVGDGLLNTIPFEVLIASRDRHPDRALKHHILIEDFAISYAPSGTLLKIIQEKQQTRNWDQSLWAFASTKFGAAAPDSSVTRDTSVPNYKDILRSARSLELRDLPYTRREVEELSRYFRDSPHRTMIDEDNMKGILFAANTSGELAKVRFLHFATHAVHPTDRPYLSGLVLAPPFPVETEKKNDNRKEGSADQDQETSAQSKLDSVLKRDKGAWRPELLTLGELSRLKLNSELVVLSACNTLGKEMIDGDWINGLARSFLMAGSSGVICTLWDAADRNTANVMPAIYQALLSEDGPEGTDVPRALQRFKRARLSFPRHAHPSTWAPFIYHGRIISRP